MIALIAATCLSLASVNKRVEDAVCANKCTYEVERSIGGRMGRYDCICFVPIASGITPKIRQGVRVTPGFQAPDALDEREKHPYD